MLFPLRDYPYNKIVRNLAMLLPIVFFTACANRGTPSGGDYDLDPPKLVSITPALKALNVKVAKTITMVFDENVQLDNPSEKVIITPPQRIAPQFTTINRKVRVDLRDSLIPNTTYVIDFTDALADNNEKNVLENFVVTFSTGDRLDSLQISGKVLDASNLEPVSGIFVGLHSNLNDSAFVKRSFDRISKTNSKGQFTIRGVAPNKYRLYALKDANRDYKYDSPAEEIAFLDSLIVPSSMAATRVDTVFKADKKTVDTLLQKAFTRFLPDNIILRSFTSSFKKQFLQKYERPQRNYFNLYFGGPTTRPKVEVLNRRVDPDLPLLEERSSHNDTIRYWITDPHVLKSDSLVLKVHYVKTDSLNIGRETSDTIKILFREFKGGKKKQENLAKENGGGGPDKEHGAPNDRPEKPKEGNKEHGNDKGKGKDEDNIKYLEIKTNASGNIDINSLLNIELQEPVVDFDHKKLVLFHLKDSIWSPVSYTLTADSLNPRKFRLSYKWKPGDDYALRLDSAALHSYYGLWNNKMDAKFKVKKEEEYGLLYITLQNLPKGVPAFAELLDKSDKPVRKSKVKDNGVLFKYIVPGTYYLRLVLDANDNGIWDPGEFSQGRQPEMVYYNPKHYEIKPNWDLDGEEWDIAATPLDKQKPLEITKNKPQEKKTKRQQLEEEEKKKQSSNKSSTTTSSSTYSTSSSQ